MSKYKKTTFVLMCCVFFAESHQVYNGGCGPANGSPDLSDTAESFLSVSY
jgi:hypothetical protein